MGFSDTLRKLLFGDPFGQVYPPKENPNPLTIDGRTAALNVLRDYVCQLTFYRANAPGLPPIAFKILPENFLIEWPDNVHEMVTPSIVVLAGPNADYGVIGLGGFLEEDSRDVYAPGTVLQWQSEYTETINLEIRASSKAERRAILAGMEIAFTPTEQMYGLRFTMPEYFDELVCFALMRRRLGDEADSAIGRRKAQLEMEVRLTIVALVNYAPFQPTVVVSTDVQADGVTPVDLDLSEDDDPATDVPNPRMNPDTTDPLT